MSLLPLMKLRLATPTVLVDVGRLATSRTSATRGDHVAIGALTRHRDLETERPARRPLRRAAGGRGRGRRQPGAPPRHDRRLGRARRPRVRPPGGAARARRDLRRSGGPAASARSPAAEFFHGFLETALAPDELLTEIRVPQDRCQRVLVPEVQPAGPGLGDRRRGRGAGERQHPRRAREHGLDAAAGSRCGGRARERRVGRRRRASTRPRAPSRRPTSTRRPSTASTSPGCSSGGRSRRRRLEPGRGRVLAAGRGRASRGRRPQAAARAARPSARVAGRSTPRSASELRPVVLVVGHTSGDGRPRAAPEGVVVVRGAPLAPRHRAQLRAALGALEPYAQVERACASGSPTSRSSAPTAYRRLAAAYDGRRELAVATYGGVRGNPVLLGRTLWAEARRARRRRQAPGC